MHQEAMQWIESHASQAALDVLDIGGRNINGSARVAWPNASSYTALDILDGSGVDIVADAREWTPDRQYDVVVCAEVFEHCDNWQAICRTAFEACKPGGLFIVTAAGPGRNVHSAIDGEFTLYPGEHYGNVEPDDLRNALDGPGFVDVVVDQQFNPCDVRASARKPNDDDSDATDVRR